MYRTWSHSSPQASELCVAATQRLRRLELSQLYGCSWVRTPVNRETAGLLMRAKMAHDRKSEWLRSVYPRHGKFWYAVGARQSRWDLCNGLV